LVICFYSSAHIQAEYCSDRAVQGVPLPTLACCICGIESRRDTDVYFLWVLCVIK